jgi:hypothetical protein
MKIERMLVVVTAEPTIFRTLDVNSCVPLAADEFLVEVNQCMDMTEFLIESRIKAPPSAGLWVIECKVEKVEADAPEGLRAVLVEWRHPTHEEIDGLLAAQGINGFEKNKITPPNGGGWTFLGSLF